MIQELYDTGVTSFLILAVGVGVGVVQIIIMRRKK